MSSPEKKKCENEDRQCRLGQRHVLVLLAFSGQTIVFAMRVSMSVVVVAMVDGTKSKIVVPSRNNVTNFSPFVSRNVTEPRGSQGEFNWPREMQGIILGAFFWGYLITQIPSGLLSRTCSCKLIYGGGVLWSGVLTLLTPLAARTSVYCLIALRVLIGFGEGFAFPALLSLLGRWAPKNERATLFTLATMGIFLGTILGQVVSGPICASKLLGGWPSVFYFFGSLTLVWIGPWMILTTDTPEQHPWISRSELQRILGRRTCSEILTDAPSRLLPVPWKRMLSDPAVWTYILCVGAQAWISYTFLNCLPQFIADRLGFPLTTNGITAAAPYIMCLPMAVAAALTSDRIIESGYLSPNATRKTFQICANLGFAVCLCGVTLVGHRKALVIVMLMGAFLCDGGTRGGLHPNALDHAALYAGSIFGIANSLATMAGIGAPFVTDLVARDGLEQQWNTIFFTCAALACAETITFLLFGSATMAPWAEPQEAMQPLLEEEGSIIGLEDSRRIEVMVGSVDPAGAEQYSKHLSTHSRSVQNGRF